MHEFVEQFFEWVITTIKVLYVTFIGSMKACLPRGILPRKTVKGEICLITGSGSGIGRLMAIEFAKLDCVMVLWDVNTAGNEETKSIIEKMGATVHAYTVDLSKREQINDTAAMVLKEVGNVDILVNNAGIVIGKPLIDAPDEWIERTMAVNASACLYTSKNFVKSMIDRNHGHVVTIASIAGKMGGAGVVDYCASKFAAVGYHESLSAELHFLKADGVKMTLVCPYFINTGMFAGIENNAVLPSEAKHIGLDYFGQNDAMTNFKGRHAITS